MRNEFYGRSSGCNKTRIARAIATITVLTVLFTTFAIAGKAQRFSEWLPPVNLGGPVNTSAFEGAPFITRNGRHLFMVRGAPADLYVATRPTSGWPWGAPVSLGDAINSPGSSEAFPFLTSDGRFLYFTSDRPGGCGASDIYVSRRLDGGRIIVPGLPVDIGSTTNEFGSWTPPQNLGCQVNSTGVELSPQIFEDEDGSVFLIFSSGLRPGGQGFGDLYFSKQRLDGTWGPVQPIAEFNTASNDIRPFIRPQDGLEIFFDSNRPGSINNSPDIYFATRATHRSNWRPATNLGELINSPAIDGGAKLSYDGTELYFMSNRPGGHGDQDIWVAKRYPLCDGGLFF